MAHSFVTCAWSFATLLSPNKKQTSKSERMMNIPGCDNAISTTHPFAAHAWSFPALVALLSPNKTKSRSENNKWGQWKSCQATTHPLAAHAWSFSSFTTLLCDAKRNIQVRIQNEQSELEQDHWYSPPCCSCLILFLPYHPSVYKIGMKKRKIFVTTKVSHYSAFRWAWRQQETYPFGAYHLHWLGWLWLFHEHNWLWAKKGWGSSWCFGGCWRGITFACLPLWFGRFGWSLSRIKEFVSNRWFEEARFLLANTACIGTHLSTFGRWWALLRKNDVSPVE